MRGLDVGMPHKTVIGITLVIRKDQDDVGGLGMDRVCVHDRKTEEDVFHV